MRAAGAGRACLAQPVARTSLSARKRRSSPGLRFLDSMCGDSMWGVPLQCAFTSMYAEQTGKMHNQNKKPCSARLESFESHPSNSKLIIQNSKLPKGGESGIRTHGPHRSSVFKTDALG